MPRNAKSSLFGMPAPTVRLVKGYRPELVKARTLRSDVPAELLDILDQAAKLGIPGTRRRVLAALKRLRDGISSAAVEEAITSGSATPIFASVDAWSAFGEELLKIFGVDGPLARVMEAATEGAISALPAPVPGLELRIVHERAAAWLAREGGTKIRLIETNTRQAIVDLVQAAFRGPAGVQQAARDIARIKGFGLTPRQTESIIKWADAFRQANGSDLTARQISARITGRHRHLIRERARVIAKTEAYNAGNAAEGELWQEAVAQDQLDPDLYVMEWMTRIVGVCPRCEALDAVTAEIGGVFVSRPIVGGGQWDGQVIEVEGPTVHPDCYCSRRIIRRDEAQDREELPLAA